MDLPGGGGGGGGGGTPALFFAHDYHPGSYTLAQQYLMPTTSSSGVTQMYRATEAQLWSYLAQVRSSTPERLEHVDGLPHAN